MIAYCMNDKEIIGIGVLLYCNEWVWNNGHTGENTMQPIAMCLVYMQTSDGNIMQRGTGGNAHLRIGALPLKTF